MLKGSAVIGLLLSMALFSASTTFAAQDGGYYATSGLWMKAVLQVPGDPVTLVWKMVGADITPSGAQVVSGYFYADPADFAYGSIYNPEVFVKVYIDPSGWTNIAFNHVTVDDVYISSSHGYNGSPDEMDTVSLGHRLAEHQYDGVKIDASLAAANFNSPYRSVFNPTSINALSTSDGYTLSSQLWAKAILQVADNPVTLVWKEVGADTTPSGDRVVSGYFYADPDDFAYGSAYNPEIFVKVYIASNGWANMAFNHVTVDGVGVDTAHQYTGTSSQSGNVTLDGRLLEHQYTGVTINESDISYTEVTMTGALSFPAGASVDLDEITVGFGNDDMAVDQAGAFQVIGNQNIPGLAVASDTGGVAMLMGIVPNPKEGQQLDLDVHSTALALAYLNPFICVSDPDDTEDILSQLESLPEFVDLENLLEQKLVANPKALSSLGVDIDGEALDDEDLSQALNDVVLAYINSYPSDIVSRYDFISSVSETKINAVAQDEPYEGTIILPNVEVSGLSLTYNGGDNFQISNSYGRWCYCVTPTENFYIFPNGTFLNVLKGTPWNPSKREFKMHITPGADSVSVDVYGYGFSSYHKNVWNSLTEEEKQYAHYGGFITVTMELASHIISVITNTSKVAGNETLAKNISGSLFGFIFSDGRTMHRVTTYISENNPTGLSWFLTKKIINNVVMSPSYRSTFSTITGLVLTDGAIKSLASWLAVPARIIILFDKVSSVLKTAMGMNTSYFKTSFSIWQDVEEFGSVQGQVADKDSGIGIKGAVVKLLGDDDNPINPSHTEITDSKGWYYFENIGIGVKTITAGKTGYKSNTGSAIIKKNETTTTHFVMEKDSCVIGTWVTYKDRNCDNTSGGNSRYIIHLGFSEETQSNLASFGDFKGSWTLSGDTLEIDLGTFKFSGVISNQCNDVHGKMYLYGEESCWFGRTLRKK